MTADNQGLLFRIANDGSKRSRSSTGILAIAALVLSASACSNGVSGGGGGGGAGGVGGGSGGGNTQADAGLPAAPQLLVDRTALRFGTEFGSGTYLGTAPQQSLSLINGGMNDLNITGVSLSGDDSTAFMVTGPKTSTLYSTDQGFITVLFAPTEARSYVATLTITSNAQNTPAQVIALTGLGVVAPDGGMRVMGGGGNGDNPECLACLSGIGAVCAPPEADGGVVSGAGADWLQYSQNGWVLEGLSDGGDNGGTCGSRYCVVVDPANPSACLDPNLPFAVQLPNETLVVHLGDTVQLPSIFANRGNTAIRFTWSIAQRPGGSAATISGPGQGGVVLSRHWKYAYLDGQLASFKPDAVGAFGLQLQAELEFLDRAYQQATSSAATLTLHVTP